MRTLLLWTTITGVLSALATGLGALVVVAMDRRSEAVKAFAEAAAAGMMISASVFSLVNEGLGMEGVAPWAAAQVIAGILAGAGFFWGIARRVERFGADDDGEGIHTVVAGDMGRRSLLVLIAMFVHSIPEGVAIGVGFATGDLSFGIILALAIAIHNIPEGVAISLPIRADGGSVAQCAWASILSSVPQPVLAVPAALAFHLAQPYLPIGFGFAAGAMIYLVVIELIPSSLDHGSKAITGWGVIVGLTAMLGITLALPGGS